MPKRPNETVSKTPLRALIIEDNPRDAELTVAALQQAGYSLSFDVVDSPEGLLEVLGGEGYDVVLSDHNLRTWNGTDALKLVRDDGKDMPFIVVTGSIGDEAAVDYIKRGATDYVLKDRLARLALAVERALEERALRKVHLKGQESLRLSEARLREAQRIAHLGDWDWDLATNQQIWSDELFRMLGFEPQSFQPTVETLKNMLHPDDLARVREAVKESLQGGRLYSAEFRIKRPNGEIRHIHSQGEIQRTPEGQPARMVGTALDNTEQKRLEQQFFHAQKLEAVGRLAGGVAHDFNNLLTVINGYCHLLLEGLDPRSPFRDSVVEILNAGVRAASLTRQLLTFSRRQIVAPQIIDLNVVVSDIEKMLRRLIGEDIVLATVKCPGLGKIKADSGQIEQILTNLAVNARDAMPKGGRLTLETANVELDETYARKHHGTKSGSFVMVAVSDTGHGMDQKTQSQMFEPFFTTKEEGKGTGLGLATVYGIVQQCGGHIWVYSELGHGTVFKIYLPRIAGADEASEKESRQSLAAPVGTETILVVEDQDVVRELVCKILKSKGYAVLKSGRGEEALELARNHTGPLHLLVTDLVMPQMGGREVAHNLSTFHPETKVLYMSGYTDDSAVKHGFLELSMNYIQKPFTPEGLARRLREVLGVISPPSSKQ